MKYQTRVTVSLKDGVLDPQGKTIGNALSDLGFSDIIKVSTGKLFILEIDAETETDAKKIAADAAAKLLSNPVIEKFNIEVQI